MAFFRLSDSKNLVCTQGTCKPKLIFQNPERPEAQGIMGHAASADSVWMSQEANSNQIFKIKTKNQIFVSLIRCIALFIYIY